MYILTINFRYLLMNLKKIPKTRLPTFLFWYSKKSFMCLTLVIPLFPCWFIRNSHLVALLYIFLVCFLARRKFERAHPTKTLKKKSMCIPILVRMFSSIQTQCSLIKWHLFSATLVFNESIMNRKIGVINKPTGRESSIILGRQFDSYFARYMLCGHAFKISTFNVGSFYTIKIYGYF